MTWLSDRVQVYTSYEYESRLRDFSNDPVTIAVNQFRRSNVGEIYQQALLGTRVTYRSVQVIECMTIGQICPVYIFFLVSTDSTVIIPGIYYSYVLYKIKIVI